MKEWLNSVNQMALLNGVEDFHFSKEVIQALAYAHHRNFTPIEAITFLRLVTNRMGDDDPDEMRKIEVRAKHLLLIAKPHERYNADLVRQHVPRFIELAVLLERQPEPCRIPDRPAGKCRQFYTDRAREWTAAQAERLSISEEAITRAIKRGWTPALIDKVSSPTELLLNPPLASAS